MKVFLKKDVEKIGMAGEILKVTDGFARNFLFPRQLAVEVTAGNKSFYENKVKKVEHRREVIESNTSMLAERLSSLTLTIKKKTHDDGKLYGAISPSEVVDAFATQGISISKSQVIFDKSIKAKGTHQATIKLTSRLKPRVTITVISE